MQALTEVVAFSWNLHNMREQRLEEEAEEEQAWKSQGSNEYML